jgi:hypothetical protein
MYSDFHFYIDFNWEDGIDKTPDIYLNNLYHLVELAYQHKVTVFYSIQRLNEFRSIIEDDLDENFSESIGNKLDVILGNAKGKGKDNTAYAFQVCFAAKNTSICHINNLLLSVIEQHNKIAIISCSNTLDYFLQINSNSEYCKIECININAVSDIINWISGIERRTFNVHLKHGENGKGNQLNASSLLCSKEKAQILLESAIPCFLEREKNLYSFDQEHNTFIMFYFEGNNPQKQWHGFHLDADKWQDIPNFVRRYFGK